MALASGRKLGPYEIQAPLGAGGMGEVYRARDTRLERTVAIKILPQHLSQNPQAKERFDREARAISSLNHPNICHLYDVGCADGLNYLVMEYLEGETLADRLHRGSLPLAQILRHGREICEGLEAAHRSGVVHRDLKPGNIMLTKSGAKLMDFGLAKPLTQAESPSSQLTQTLSTPDRPLTAQGMIVGTFQYMSPEQVEGKEADIRSDVFALGAVLYEMTTGTKAFEGKTAASTIAAILASEPKPIRSLQPASPPALDRAVTTCLAKDPDERFQSVHDLKLQLLWMGEAEPASTSKSATRWWKSAGLAWGTCAIFAVLLGWLLVIAVMKPAPASFTVRSEILPPPNAEFFSHDVEGGTPAISPDGRQMVVAVRDKSGSVMLWLRAVDSETMHPLAGTEGASHPFWSPDSHAIGYFAERKLKRVDDHGGNGRTLCDVSATPRGGSWSRDGVILFTPGTGDRLYRVSAEGGTPVLASEFDREHLEDGHRWPQFLPDGKRYLFFLRSFDKERTGIYLGSLDSKEHRLLLNTGYAATYVPPGYLLYVQAQTLVAQPFDERNAELKGQPTPLSDHPAAVGGNSASMFSASETGTLLYYPALTNPLGWHLTWRDRTGKDLGNIGTGFFARPAISPDSSKVAVEIYDLTWWTPDLWILDLVRGTKTRFTFGPGSSGGAIWRPDGRAVIYNSNTTGYSHIFSKNLNGQNPEKILETEGFNESARSICRDGRYLAYMRWERTPQSKREIWGLPLFGDRKPFPLVQSQFDALDSVFSPDCKWMAFTSSEPGQPEVYIVSFPDGARKYHVSTGGGTNPSWRGDGKELFFFAPQSSTLVAVDVAELGQELRLGTPHALFQTFGVGYRLGLYGVTQDGQKFLINGDAPTIGNIPLTLVTNWDAVMRK
ncbi:MAG TPA: protein kinase [Candidatus Sulfotelmatobacter sp.]|nr:protein kinase [Candidatus Sulfotelmatobacter sp.]